MRAAELGLAVGARAAYLPAADALCVADLHLGRDATSAVEFPLAEHETIERRLRTLLDRFSPAEVVFAGDVLHAFDGLPPGVADSLAALRDAVEAAGSDLAVVAGNHDTMLAELVDVVPEPEHRLADGTVVCHGHEAPDADGPRYVIGHDHPAIEIEGRRRPCLLHGRGVYRGADVLCLPAFNHLAAGTRVNGLRGRDAGSPLLADLDAFRPIVHDEGSGETFVFPPLGDVREFL